MANASHLLLELLQRGGFAASMVLWRVTKERKRARPRKIEREEGEKEEERERRR